LPKRGRQRFCCTRNDFYLHLVSAVDTARGRVQISNNRGRVNGWTNHRTAFGICVAVDGKPVTGAQEAVQQVE
jgi:hypothetical protein